MLIIHLIGFLEFILQKYEIHHTNVECFYSLCTLSNVDLQVV
jgi:hypothetical protein